MNISDLSISGTSLSFNVFPKVLAILPWSNFWVFLFFTALVFLGIDSEFGLIESVFCYLKDELKLKGSINVIGFKINLERAQILTIVFMFILSPFLVSSASIYYL